MVHKYPLSNFILQNLKRTFLTLKHWDFEIKTDKTDSCSTIAAYCKTAYYIRLDATINYNDKMLILHCLTESDRAFKNHSFYLTLNYRNWKLYLETMYRKDFCALLKEFVSEISAALLKGGIKK